VPQLCGTLFPKKEQLKCADLKNAVQLMDKAVDFFHDQLKGIRWGVITPGLLDSVRIPHEGQKVPLQHLAWTSPNKGQISITPYDPKHVGFIANALKAEGFNAYPFSKTTVVVSLPQRSGEDREKVISHIGKLAEEARVSIRNIRKKTRQKAKDVDLIDEELQELTNRAIGQIDSLSYRNRESVAGYFFFGVLLCLPFCVWAGLRIYNGIVYDIHCGGHLKRAADANTVDMAKKELAEVLKYLEDNKMTEGYTSVLWKTPSEDVGFWYQNLKSAKEELDKVTPETTQLERTNVLMKLRETLLDHGEKGDSVTAPGGISVFPSNTPYFIFGWLTGLIGCGGAFCLVVGFFKMS
jgi:ribosome recycling factor